MKKNDIFTTEITGYTSEGLGICRIDNTVVFVAETAVGDKLDVRITKVMKSYAFGRKERMIAPSAQRIQNDCRNFPMCGGCDFRHISYEEELSFKKQRVADVLHHITGIELSPEEIIGADKTDNYRNKAQFPVRMHKGTPSLGFYRERSHDIIPLDNCLIQSPECEALIAALKKWMNEYNVLPYDEAALSGSIRHLYVRSNEKEILVCIVTSTSDIPHKKQLVDMLLAASDKIKGVVQSINTSAGNKILGDKFKTLYGNDFIYDCIGNLRFKISVQSFFQVNTAQAYKLYSRAKEYAELTGNENVIDLYCGTGTIGLFMADKAKKVFGMEIVPDAIKDAKLNAELNNITNAEFAVGDATQFNGNVFGSDTSDTIVFIDPPRKGLTDELIHTITGIKPLKVVYISCDPATMARDLKTFIKDGYEPIRCTAVDMFPRTRHVEAVVLLSRKNDEHGNAWYIPENNDCLESLNTDATYTELKEWIAESIK